MLRASTPECLKNGRPLGHGEWLFCWGCEPALLSESGLRSSIQTGR